MNQKLEQLKSLAMERVHNAGDRAKQSAARVQTSMRTSPMKWAGVAAGAGVVLGIIGRIVRSRSRRSLPDLVIIDASC